jgi:hypothetical protein
MKGTVFPIEPVLNVCGNFSEYDEYIKELNTGL